MADQFYPQSGLASILAGAQQGADWKQRREKSKLDMILAKNRDREGTEQFGVEQGYVKPNYDEEGNFQGYGQNDQNYERDIPIYKRNLPQIFPHPSDAPPAAPAVPAPAKESANNILDQMDAQENSAAAEQQRQADRNAMIARMKASGQIPADYTEPQKTSPTAPQPDMQPGDPKPLLRDHKAQADLAKHERTVEAKTLGNGQKALLAPGTDRVEYNPNSPGHPGVDASGKPIKVIDATKTHVSQQQDLPVTGDPGEQGAQGANNAAPAPSAVSADPNADQPSPFLMHRLGEYMTTIPHHAADPEIPVDNLPPEWRQKLKIDPNFHGAIRASLIKNFMMAENRMDVQGLKNQGTSLDPTAVQLLGGIQSGDMEPGDAVEAWQEANSGRPVPKHVVDAFYGKAGGQRNKDRTFGLQSDRLGLQKEKFGQSQRDKAAGIIGAASYKAMSANVKELEVIASARDVQDMVQRKETAGLEGKIALLLSRAFGGGVARGYEVEQMTGVTGAGNIAQALAAKVSGEGLTPQNRALFMMLGKNLEQKAAQKISAQTSGYAQSAIRQLLVHGGMGQDEATAAVRGAMDPRQLMQMRSMFVTPGGSLEDMNRPAAPAGKLKTPLGPEPEKKDVANLRALTAKTNKALQDLAADANANPSQKRIWKKQIMDKFKEKTGIEWSAPGGG